MAKKEQIRAIFNDIAPQYDNLNHLLSLGIDKGWRRKALKEINGYENANLLDIACGTGDFAIAAYKAGAANIIGIDISDNMVAKGVIKIKEMGLDSHINLQIGDAENINYPDSYFDVETVAFGVRNFENIDLALKEMLRVLKPGGKLIILEFSMPRKFPMKQLYKFYFKYILPFIGGCISGNRKAYQYLPSSVMKFPQAEEFKAILSRNGFLKPQDKRLTFGIASIYTATKDR